MIKAFLKRILASFNYTVQKKQFNDELSYLKSVYEVNQETNPVVFDVGANIGNYAQKLLSVMPSLKLHCFEPYPISFGKLQARFTSFPNVITEQVALSYTNTEIDFYVDEVFHETNSVFRPIDYKISDVIKVKATTIDEYCHSLNINRIHVLKIDVQGAEYNVLSGAKNLLLHKKIDLIRVEVIFKKLYDGQSFFGETLKFLQESDYSLSGFVDCVYKDGHLLWADAIFVK